MSTMDSDQLQPLTANLRHLIETYGKEAGLPSLNDPHLAADLVKKMDPQTKISEVAVRQILINNAASNPQVRTRQALKSVFKNVLPDMEESWLALDDHGAFRRLVLGSLPNLATLHVPDLYVSSDKLKNRLGGTFLVYRFSFHQKPGKEEIARGEEEVAREVLHVEQEKHTLRFRMSFWGEGSDQNQPALIYNGVVLPIGMSVIFVGFSNKQTKVDRGRTLTLHREDAPASLKDLNLGLLTSTRMHLNSDPVVVCAIIVRIQWKPDDLEKFIQKATRIASFAEIIEKDFGPNHATKIRTYLDNRPHGKELVLRINMERFNTEMPDIFAKVCANSSIRAPFKSNWVEDDDLGKATDGGLEHRAL